MYKKLKSKHIVTKIIFQCLIGTIEYIGIPIFLAFITTMIKPFSSNFILWQWIERTAFCFTFYEVIVIIIRKLIIDIRIDSLLALHTAYKKAEFCCTSGNNTMRIQLQEEINKELNSGIMNPIDIRNEYKMLLTFLGNNNIVAIQYKMIVISHALEAQNLFWNYTLLLRLFK